MQTQYVTCPTCQSQNINGGGLMLELRYDAAADLSSDAAGRYVRGKAARSHIHNTLHHIQNTYLLIIKLFTMENLCQLTYTVNKTLYKNPLQDAKGNTFRIESPTIFKLNFCSPKEMAAITGIFTGLELVHNVTFYPPGYCKGQKQPAYDIEINLGYGGTEFACNLLEFGCSFGKMQFEG